MARIGRPPKIDLDVLRQLRAEGMSQKKIAKRLGVSQPAVSYAINVRLAREEEAR